MKEFNSKVIIGRERSRMNVLVWMIIFVGGSLYTLINVYGIMRIDELAKVPFYMGNVQFVQAFLIILVMGLIWVAFSTMLFLGSNQFIQINEKYFSYCESRGMYRKLKQFINICLNHEQSFDLQVNIKDIEYLRLTYSDYYVWMFLKGHAMVYDVYLKDGTILRILPDNLRLRRENCLEGIEYLEKLGVVVEDPYHLKEALRQKNFIFSEYVEKMEKKHES